MKAYIECGHGEGGDPGAVNNELIEHQMTLVTGNALGQRLKELGWEVMIEQGNLEMTENARIANNFGADIYISVHYNAGGGERGEVIYSWENGALKLAEAVANGLYNSNQPNVKIYKSKANSSGTAEYFGSLRASNMPAVIIEPCFIDHSIDRTRADTKEEQEKIGYNIADALHLAYGGAIVPVEQWKIDIMNKGIKYGLISADANHKPDETATKWFMIAVMCNLLEKYGLVGK